MNYLTLVQLHILMRRILLFFSTKTKKTKLISLFAYFSSSKLSMRHVSEDIQEYCLKGIYAAHFQRPKLPVHLPSLEPNIVVKSIKSKAKPKALLRHSTAFKLEDHIWSMLTASLLHSFLDSMKVIVFTFAIASGVLAICLQIAK